MRATVAGEEAQGQLRKVDLVCEGPADFDEEAPGIQGVPLPADSVGALATTALDGGSAYVLYDRGEHRELAVVNLEAGVLVDLNGDGFGLPKPQIDGATGLAAASSGALYLADGGAGVLKRFVPTGDGDHGDGWFSEVAVPNAAGAVERLAAPDRWWQPDTLIAGVGPNLTRLEIDGGVAARAVPPGFADDPLAFVAVQSDPSDTDRTYAIIRSSDGTWRARLIAYRVTGDDSELRWTHVLQEDADPANVAEAWQLAVSARGDLVFAAPVGAAEVTALHHTGQELPAIVLPSAVQALTTVARIPLELCDGVDQTCDGEIDEDVPGRHSAVGLWGLRGNGSIQVGDHADVTWDGEGWAIAWTERTADGIYLRRLTADGTRQRGEEVRILATGGEGLSLEAGEDSLLVSWVASNGNLMTMRVGADNTVLAGPNNLGGHFCCWGGGRTGLQAIPGGYVVAFSQRSGVTTDMTIRRLDADGLVEAGPLTVAGDDEPVSHKDLAWNGAEVAVAWAEGNAVRFGRLNPGLMQFEGQVMSIGQLGNGSHGVAVDWDGNQWGVWSDLNSELRFRPVSAAGVPGAITAYAGRAYQGLDASWDGESWALVYSLNRGPGELQRVRPNGAKLGDPVQATPYASPGNLRVAHHRGWYAILGQGGFRTSEDEAVPGVAIGPMGCFER